MTCDDPHRAVFGNGKQLRLGDGTESTDDQPDVRLMVDVRHHGVGDGRRREWFDACKDGVTAEAIFAWHPSTPDSSW